MALKRGLEHLSGLDLAVKVEALPFSVFQLEIFAAIAALLLWSAGLCVYRLYFSPLAKFPGDRLAAISGWVETYYDVFQGGQLIFKLADWHAKYGPIVRINPWEIHIADPEFTKILLAGNSHFDKKIEWKYRFGIPHSSFDTIEHDHHRARRSAVAPFFSKQKIGGITGFVDRKAQRLCDRLETEYKGGDDVEPVILNHCFTALTFDVITYYTFARPFDYMEYPNFRAPFTNAARELATTLHTMGHFPWLRSLLQSLPQSWAKAMNPTIGAVFAFHQEIEDQIRAIKSGANDSHKDVAHKTVFSELLNSDLPANEKTVERLKHEAGSLVGGGVETTATALTKACFWILDNPQIRSRFVAELETVFPDPRVTPPLATLEPLPYLGAIINETLRLTIGISSRTIRKSRRGPVHYKGHLIPAGAYFSMTTYYTHTDPAVWEAPHEFRPERWLPPIVEDVEGAAAVADSRKPEVPRAKNGELLSEYLVPFGRGPRMCLGMNLARAELFITLAVVFRRCDFQLFETTRDAVDMRADYFIPFPDPKIEGVKVVLK